MGPRRAQVGGPKLGPSQKFGNLKNPKNYKSSSRDVKLLLEKFVDEKCIVDAPQCLRDAREGGRGSWKYEELNEWLRQLKSTLPIDDKRIFLMGNSMGGYGSWMWGGNTPKHFAAIAPIVGGIGPNGPKDVTKDLNKWA